MAGLYLLSRQAFLLFHTLAELFSVSVAFAIFMIVWNSRHFMQNSYMLFIGIAYFFVGGFDLLHTLAYEGMGVFPEHGANLATQLWIGARYMEGLSFLLASLLIRRRLRADLVVLVYAFVSGLLLLAIFQWKVFPVCFGETGLTAFKSISEYVIMAVLLASLVVLRRRAGAFDSRVIRWVSLSIVLTIVSEFMFTLYRDPEGQLNTIGHLLKLASFFVVYKALIETGLREPYHLMYRDLKQHETDLEKARDQLEARVRQRTGELSQTVQALREEVQARMRAEQRILADKQQLRVLTGQLLGTEDKERRAIATELHDSVGQILAFVKMELGEVLRSQLPENVLRAVRRIREQIDEAITRTRSLTFEISPPELYTLGLESAIEELAQRFGRERRLECRVHDSEEDKPLNEEVKTLLYRSVRELLINAAKHAQAKVIDITLSRVDGCLQVVVEDDGVGFDPDRLAAGAGRKAAGFGLFSIRERLTHLGGKVYIESNNGRGTRVTLLAPLCRTDETLQ
ncbi:MAG: ATP-binding protein [Sedimentisphaerales bacterium]|nr:ATP-binding protein [Sedimentisphaerales bacterium]